MRALRAFLVTQRGALLQRLWTDTVSTPGITLREEMLMASRKRYRPLAAVAVLAWLPIGMGMSGAQAASPPAPEPLLPSESLAVQVRSHYGLDVRPETIAARDRSAASVRMNTVALSRQEAAEVNRRDALGGTASQFGHAERATDAAFSGVSVDPGTGVVTYASTNVADVGEQARVKAALPPGSDVRFVVAEYSYNELQALSLKLGEARQLLTEAGIAITGHGVDEKNNRLRVYIEGTDDPGTRAKLSASLGASAAAFEIRGGEEPPQDFSTRHRTTGKAYAGLYLTVNGNGCTTGTANAESNSKPGQFYVITAGHCGPLGSAVEFGRRGFSPNPTPLRSVIKNFTTGRGTRTTCDCALIGPLESTSSRLSSDVVVENDQIFDYTAVGRLGASYFPGRGVFASGAYTNSVNFATIDLESFGKFTENETELIDQVLLDRYPANLGDSGGPIGASGNYLGLIQGTGTRAGMAMTKTAYLSDLNVTLRWNNGF